MNIQFFYISLLSSIIFIRSASAHVRKFSQHDFNKWLDADNFVIALFCSSLNDHGCITEREKMKTLSEEMTQYRDIVFGYVDEESDPILINQYNIQKFPTIKFFPYNTPAQPYPPNSPITEFNDRIMFTRKQFYKRITDSKSVTKFGKKSSMTEIVATKFEYVAKHSGKHVMIMLYSGDCKELCAIVESVAKLFEEDPEVGFFKLNVEKTDTLRHTFSFAKDPTLYWYPMKAKNGFIYGGAVSFKVLVEYINDHAGLSRNYNGGLKSDAGRIGEIDEIIEENIFDILHKSKLNKVINMVEKKSKTLPHPKKYIDYYLGVLRELNKGIEPGKVLKIEQDFLYKKLRQGNKNSKEHEEYRKFYNIITAFVDYAANYHQSVRTKRPSPRKSKTPLPDPGGYTEAELKEDPKWKRRSRHEEL